MSENRKLDEALMRLVISAKNGSRAKAQLAKKLASMTPAQLRSVKPSVFTALGPRGINLFAEARGKDSGLMPVIKPPKKRAKLTLAEWRRGHPWATRAIVVVTCLMGGGVVERTVALRADTGELSATTYQGWPVCERLEKVSTGCVYFITSHNLDLDRIAAQTGLPIETVVESNPTIDFHYRLSPGTMLIIPGNIFH